MRNAFTILVEDRYRFHTTSTVRITHGALHDALSEVSVLLTDEVAFSLNVPGWPLICSLLDVRSPKHMFWKTLDYLQCLANALTIGLVSFSGSHVCPFDKNLWGEEKNSTSVRNGYAFALHELACLKDFVDGPAWVLGKDPESSQAHGLKISLTVKGLQELWHPIWYMEGGDDAGAF